MLILLAMAAQAEPATFVNCSGLGAALAFVGGGGALVSAEDDDEPVGVVQGRWTLRFLSDELGRFEVRPDTLLVAWFPDERSLRLSEWTSVVVEKKMCKALRKGQLPEGSRVLVEVPLAR